MNTIFLIALFLYLAVFVVIGIIYMRKVQGFTDYAVAGRKQGVYAVTMHRFDS